MMTKTITAVSIAKAMEKAVNSVKAQGFFVSGFRASHDGQIVGDSNDEWFDFLSFEQAKDTYFSKVKSGDKVTINFYKVLENGSVGDIAGEITLNTSNMIVIVSY